MWQWRNRFCKSMIDWSGGQGLHRARRAFCLSATGQAIFVVLLLLGLLGLGSRAAAQVTFTQITNTTGGFFDSSPSINSNGNRIAFASDRNLIGSNADGNGEIFLWTQGSGITQITNTTGGSSYNPSINADGTRIAFASDRNLIGSNADGNEEIFLWTQGSGITQITNTTGFGYFSPSINSGGTRIAFTSDGNLIGDNPDGSTEIFLWTQGSGFTQITNAVDGKSEAHSINADGTRIAFRSVTGGKFEIFLWTQGSGITQITNTTGGSSYNPSINADGTRIAFTSDRNLTGGNADGNEEIFLAQISTVDTTLPSIAISSPVATGQTYSTGTATVNVSGTASDNVGVVSVYVANNRGGAQFASGTTNWSATGIALQAGSNILTAHAIDAAGNDATASITVNYTTVTTGNLTVTVRRSDTNAPLSGATVSLGGPSSPASQTTAGDGTTTFWNLLAGSYTVSVSLAGFQSHSVSVTLIANTGMGIAVILTPTPPVVLLHGWGGNGQVGGTFGQMKPLLEQHGFAGRVYVYDYSALTSCASTGVGIRQLAGKFQEWLSNNGLHGTQIDVVAHSMGGLVARTYMVGMGVRADGAAVSYGGEIQRLVMIGTPNGGVRAGVFAALASFYGCLPNPLNPNPSSSLSIQAAEQQVGSSFLQTLESEWQKRQPLAPQNMLVIAGIKGNLAVIFPIPGHLSCLDSTSPEGDDDGVVNVMNAYLPGALQREVPYKHASMIPCPIDGIPQAFINSSDHLTFATFVPFLQTGTAPTLYTRRPPGGIWQFVTQLLPFHDIASGVDAQSPATLTWTEVPGGGLTPVSPAVAAAPNGDVYVVVRGIDQHIYLNTQRNGTWLGWTAHPSGLTGSSPAAVVDVNGNLQVFVRGVDDALYQSTYSGGGWGGWAEVPGGGFTFSAPEAAVNRVTGEITLVVRGIDSQIYLNTFNGAAWSGWSAVPVGGLTLSELAAAYDASGTLWLFARGLDAGIWVTSGRGGSWTGWMGLGGTTHSGLAAVASGNTVAVFAHGSDNRIYQNTYANQWSGWNEVPGSGLTLDSPTATVDSQGNVLLFVRGM